MSKGKQKNTVAAQMKQKQKMRDKTERFLVPRMWFSTIISSVFRDRGSIPANIGNNIMIGNNQYVTKGALTAMILVVEMSSDTPMGFISDMIESVKNKVPEVAIDVCIKAQRKEFDINGSDMKSRIRTWERSLDSPGTSETNKYRSARCLYTVEVAKSGEQLYKGQMYVSIHAPTGSLLQRGIDQTSNYLSSIGAAHRIIKSDIKRHMQLALIMSDRRAADNKDIPSQIYSRQTLAEILPITQGMNDTEGTFMGIDRKMLGPYFINFRSTAKAKNIVCCAGSGSGKTFLVQNWFLDMHATGYNMCIMDIKGTEFGAFTRAAGGVVLSLRPNSTFYVNTFKLDKEEARDDPRVYFDERFNLSKETMMILADLPEDMRSQGEALTEEFMQALYLEAGVAADNPNTWYRTNTLNPYVVYEQFEHFCSFDIKQKYPTVAQRMLTRLSIYMSRTGSNSHMFRDAFDYHTVLDTKVLCFDFGMLGMGESTDQAMFKVRVLYMNLLNDQYVAYKYSLGEWTGKVLEESGIAADYLIRLYAKDFMLRRSQNQVTILLGNSISNLATNKNANGILENANILVLGSLNKSSREYLVEEFGLDKEVDELEALVSNPDYMNTFLLVNKMQKDATTALLKAYVPDHVVKGALFKIVDTEDED